MAKTPILYISGERFVAIRYVDVFNFGDYEELRNYIRNHAGEYGIEGDSTAITYITNSIHEPCHLGEQSTFLAFRSSVSLMTAYFHEFSESLYNPSLETIRPVATWCYSNGFCGLNEVRSKRINLGRYPDLRSLLNDLRKDEWKSGNNDNRPLLHFFYTDEDRNIHAMDPSPQNFRMMQETARNIYCMTTAEAPKFVPVYHLGAVTVTERVNVNCYKNYRTLNLDIYKQSWALGRNDQVMPEVYYDTSEQAGPMLRLGDEDLAEFKTNVVSILVFH